MGVDHAYLGQDYIRGQIGRGSRHDISHHDQGDQQGFSPEPDIRQCIGEHS